MPVWPQYNYMTLVNSDAVPFRRFGGVRSDVKILFSSNLPPSVDGGSRGAVCLPSSEARGNLFHGKINCWFVRCITMRAQRRIRTNRSGFAVWVLSFGRF